MGFNENPWRALLRGLADTLRFAPTHRWALAQVSSERVTGSASPSTASASGSGDHTDSGDADQGTSTHRRHRRRRSPIQRFFKRVRKVARWQLIITTLLVVLIVPSAAVMALAADSNVRVQESLLSLRRVLYNLNGRSLAQFSQSDFDRLQHAVDDLSQTLDSASQKTGILRSLSKLRPDIRATFSAMDTAQEVVKGANDILTGLQPTMFYLIQGEKDKSSPTQFTSGERLVELLKIGQGRFLKAKAHLDAAQQRIKALDLTDLTPQLLLLAQELIKYQSQLQDINEILLNSPDLLTKAFGLSDSQTYLILSANSDELRPSGGYISTWGWLRVRRLRVTDYGYAETTPTSPNPPPDELGKQLNAPSWWIQNQHPVYQAWDGSWTPDFPTTAKMAAWYYDSGKNPRSPVDGVIGIDLVGFEYILGGLGSVTVPDYNETITADNLRQVVYRIRETTQGDEEHKKFLAAVYREIFRQWQDISQTNSDALFAATVKALREKHIMMYFKDEKLNKAISLLGWAGAQAPATDSDYLMVADTNMGSKSNRSIARQITYDVQIQDDGSLQSHAAISYDFSAQVAANDPGVNPANYNNINYFNIMQVFVPAGSKLTDSKNLQAKLDTTADAAHTDFVTLTETKFDSTERFQFMYTTPPLIQSFGPYQRYKLLLQKQPGMIAETASVQVTMPANAKLVSVNPPPVASYSLGLPILEFRVTLTTDQVIEITYTQ